jgi:putative OPT family oligopeptide transporter
LPKKQGLAPNAYLPLAEEEVYEPYVDAGASPPEFTGRSVTAGILFGILFGAANAYLGLRAGLTISTSIPVAVLTVAAFRALAASGQRSSILEANMSQTVGSASSSVASGVIFTLPALFLWEMAPGLLQMTLLAMSGGLLGVLFMIPLRRFLIDKEHGHLPYPEGTACAEVLVASEVGGSRAQNVFKGLAGGALFKVLTSWARVIPDDVHVFIPGLPKGRIGMDLSAALFGVGFILGPRVASIMVGGGALASLVIIPAIAAWGGGRTEPFYPETVDLIRDMSPGDIWNRYVRYIGAGAVATGGIITLVRSIPVMVSSFYVGAEELRERMHGSLNKIAIPRTAQDLPLKVTGVGALVIFLVLAFIPQVFAAVENPVTRVAAALLVVICAFFFVTVASRIVGLVGVTSNPTSGMTIATLLATSGVFLLMGWTGDMGRAAALTVGCVVAIAASISGDTSQDLKTGFLLGATPRRQQTGELLGVLTSAVFVCLAVILLARAFGFGSEELPAPQATLMKLVIDGVLEQELPWVLVGIGAGLAVLCELVRIPSLPFAVGVYLPVATMTPIFLGGLLRVWLERSASSKDEASARRERGVLLGSGFVGGEGLLGVAIAAVAFILNRRPGGLGYEWMAGFAPWAGLLLFGLLVVWFARSCGAPTDRGAAR